MTDLTDLYQEVILDHNRRPRNFHNMSGENQRAEGFNPLCGDRLTVYLHLDGDIVSDISFEGSGCAISKASASLMTESLKGKSRAEAETMFRTFHDLVTGGGGETPATDRLGKLVVFSGVRDFPVRVKCATLAWHTLMAALRNSQKVATTE
ncbi:MAG: SUF system NifU family Fe-S cluster assembly protein [Acidobacteria bacterium]|nr:SUF system NifU family Fe-S cluster assembly protein [Acidobacteriota bacterium]